MVQKIFVKNFISNKKSPKEISKLYLPYFLQLYYLNTIVFGLIIF